MIYSTRLTHTDKARWGMTMILLAIAVLICGTETPARGAFDCRSNGSDGALTFDAPTTPTTIEFDPASYNPPLDPDHDGVYHFTTVNIPALLTVRFVPNKVGWNPVYWLCQGDVDVSGTLDFSGANGHSRSDTVPGQPSIPGPGGFPGGWGKSITLGIPAHVGFGPGQDANGGKFSGNLFLLPLVGGNGGGGGMYAGTSSTAGGGAGGGAFLLASNTTIRIEGSVLAKGGDGGSVVGAIGSLWGSGGAGGAVRLMAPTVTGKGELSALRGDTNNSKGQYGVIRIETQNDTFTGLTTSDKVRRVALMTTGNNIFPSEGSQYARLVRIGGIELPIRTSGSFTVPDAVINTTDPVLFEIGAHNIPLGTTFTVLLWNETAQAIEFTTGGLTGTLASSTATATHTIPSDYTRGYIYATWTK